MLVPAGIFTVFANFAPLQAQVPSCGSPVDSEQLSTESRSTLNAAYTAFEEGRLEEAIAGFEEALLAEPCQPAVHAQLAYAYGQLDDLEPAIAAMGTAVEIGYDDPRAPLQVGYWSRSAGDEELAQQWFQRAMNSADPSVVEDARMAMEAEGGSGSASVCLVDGAVVSMKDAAEATRHLNAGYEALEAGNTAAAAAELDRGASLAPCRTDALAQAAYAFAELGQYDIARDRMRTAVERGYPNPGAHLQLGYWADHELDPMAARGHFADAMRSDDPEVAAQGRAELVVRGGAPGIFLTEVYGAPMYQSRFDNVVVPVVVRAGPILTARRLTQAYGLLRITRDSQSRYGADPEIFSENAAVVGGGIRFRPTGGSLTAYGEAGWVMDLVDNPGPASVEGPSFQAGLYDFRVFGLPRDDDTPETGLFSELYYDGSYYSRFDNNVIGYAQLRSGVRRNNFLGGTLDAYVPMLAVADGRGNEYNNVAEAGAGIRLALDLLGNITLSAEYLRGFYYRGSVAGEKSYDDLRISVITPVYLSTGR